jgi:sugar/nucleoside kinase (ribokinase family)
LSTPRYDVCGLGNALVDALVRIDDDSVLAELGVPRGHMTPVDHARWQAAFDRVQPHGVAIHSGGSCANTIATLGMMGLQTRYCGQVGDDQLGHLYAARMTEACGGHALRFTREGNTGKCLSIISAKDAERTMLTDLGAAVGLPGLGDFDRDIRDARVFHTTGYLLLGAPMIDRALEAIAVANQEQIPVSLDVADPFVVRTVRDQMWEIVRELVDIVFLNAEEAEVLTGKAPEEAVHLLAEVCDTVVLKLGARGSLVHHGGELYPVGVHKVDAVDTTGAGDAYAAGFLYGMVRGWPVDRSAALGARIAGHAVAQIGAVVRDRDLLARAIADVKAG